MLVCAGPEMWEGLCSVLPNLELLSCDSTHLVMAYESAHWRKHTVGSTWLRLAQAKFEMQDPNLGDDSWGAPFACVVVCNELYVCFCNICRSQAADTVCVCALCHPYYQHIWRYRYQLFDHVACKRIAHNM